MNAKWFKLNFFFNSNEIVAVLLPQDIIKSGFDSN